MKYKTLDRQIIDISAMSDEERDIVDWLRREALQSSSWVEFHNRTSLDIVEKCKKLYGTNWQHNSLYEMQQDLRTNLSIKFGREKGKPSKMFYE